MSHHLDTPLARQSGQLYIDDLFVYEANGATVFAMDVNSTITGADITPGFGHEARYEIKVHFDGADYEALTYRVTFGEPDAGGRQSLQLHVLTDEDARDDTAMGELVLEGFTGEAVETGEVRIWAGRVADPFYIDLSLLEIVNGAVRNGTALDLSGWSPRRQRTASAARRSRRSSWRSPTSTRCCVPVGRSACGASRVLRPTRAAGGRSTARDTP
jgi:hypothetical protein